MMQSPKKEMAGVISFYPNERPDLIEQLNNLKFNYKTKELESISA